MAIDEGKSGGQASGGFAGGNMRVAFYFSTIFALRNCSTMALVVFLPFSFKSEEQSQSVNFALV
ncbi:MAG: hypothetical protein M3P08_16095 [Thermoproteota archaeon]|nr:hypothetical protein [Thermoproteota archaeon]